MKTLAIDTATAAATVAVVEDGCVLGVMTLNLKKPHSQKIMLIVKKLLDSLDLDIKDVDLFAAAHGPGSFTGLRVGIATIKGFADSLNKPAVGVSTLETMAHPYLHYGDCVCPMIDARREQVYYALYKRCDETQTIFQPDCQNIKNVLCQLACLNKKIVFTGEGVHMHKELIEKELGNNAVFVDEAYCVNNAAGVALIGEKIYTTNKKQTKVDLDYVLKAYTGND